MEGIGNRGLVVFRVGKIEKTWDREEGKNGEKEKNEREEVPWHPHNKFATLEQYLW